MLCLETMDAVGTLNKIEGHIGSRDQERGTGLDDTWPISGL